jgi:methionyl-tRNA synthetase
LYFPLGSYEPQLRAYYQSVVMNPRLRKICEGMLADGLPDIVVGHPADWGIPVPLTGFEDQRIYVWFEVATGLLSASQLLSEKFGLKEGWKEFWRADDIDVVQFCGFDNGYFYGILIPALLLAYDPQIKLPTAVLLNEFYRLDGSKFSTSRNHAIWCRELVKRVPLDTIRFYLALNGPETEQTNFTMADYEETIRRELVEGWQDWLRELGTKLATEYDGVAPHVEGDLTSKQLEFYDMVKNLVAEAAAAYEIATYSPRRAAGVLLELVHAALEFSETQDQNGTALQLAAAKTLAALSSPIMPGFAIRLWQDLGDSTPVRWDDNPQWVPAGTRINNLDQPYFVK